MASTDERRVAAWVGKSLTIQGRISSAQDLTIDGTVEGTIEVGNFSLTIGPSASIKADLAARAITISGDVTGNVRAVDRVELQATAVVNGDIETPMLVMADGAVVSGTVEAWGRKGKSS